MSRPWMDSDQGQQGEFLSLHAGHALPADHPARVLMAQVEEMDLSKFTAAYRDDGVGRPPYHPRVMVALLLYCHADGRVTPQQVADACHDDLGCRLITGNRFPDRRTIRRFLSEHRQAWADLLPQTLAMGHERDMVDVSTVAGDGTTVPANAAMSATVTEEELLGQIGWFEQRLDEALARWQATLPVDEHRYTQLPLVAHPAAPSSVAAQVGLGVHRAATPDRGHDDTPATETTTVDASTTTDQAWRQVLRLLDRLRGRQDALARLRDQPSTALSDWHERLASDQARVLACQQRLDLVRTEVAAANARRAEAEAAGARIPGRRPVPVDEHVNVRRARQALDTATARAQKTALTRPVTGRINTTDPGSRIMPAKNGGYDQMYNVQALAASNQFVIAIGVHDNPNDKRALTELLRCGRANLDQANITTRIGAALFDSGYASAENFTTDHPVDLLLVAVEKEARQTGRLDDGASTAKKAWQDMADLHAKPANAALYKRRAAIIEPLFAQLFARFGRRLHVRGADVQTQLHLWAVAHNLLKIARHDRRKASTG